MDYNDVLKSAENNLSPENLYIIEDIKKYIRAGSTGGEIDSIVGKYVKDLQVTNSSAYHSMEEAIVKYLFELAKRGIFVT